MKRIILLILLISLGITCAYAQFPARVANNISLCNTRITSKVSASSIHPVDVGYSIDSAFNLIGYLYTLIGSSGNLQSVTDIGNTTTDDIFITDGTHNLIGLRNISGGGGLWINSNIGSGFETRLFASGTTANRGFLLGNEPFAIGLGTQSEVVTHKTSTKIIVKDMAGNDSVIVNSFQVSVTDGTIQSDINKASFRVHSPTGTLFSDLSAAGGTGHLDLYDGVSALYKVHLSPSALSANQGQRYPNASGTFLLREDSLGGTGGDPVFITNTYLNGQIDSLAAVGGGTINQVLTNGFKTNRNLQFGKFVSTNPFSGMEVLITTDSSYWLNFHDTANIYTLEAGWNFANTDERIDAKTGTKQTILSANNGFKTGDGTNLIQITPSGSLIFANGSTITIPMITSTAPRTYTLIDRSFTFDNVTGNTTTSFNGLLKGNGSNVTLAVANTDYLGLPTFNLQTGTSYTLLASDYGKTIVFNNSSAITLTVPSGLGATFYCTILQRGTGLITPTASGTTLVNGDGFTKSAGINLAFSIIFTETTNTYEMQGRMQ